MIFLLFPHWLSLPIGLSSSLFFVAVCLLYTNILRSGVITCPLIVISVASLLQFFCNFHLSHNEIVVKQNLIALLNGAVNILSGANPDLYSLMPRNIFFLFLQKRIFSVQKVTYSSQLLRAVVKESSGLQNVENTVFGNTQ